MPNKMAAQPNIGGALCESSVIPFLVACRKLWLTLAVRVPCSNAANIGERKTWTQSEFCTWQNSVRGQQRRRGIWRTSPGDGQTSCKVWLASSERRRCSKEAKTRNALKFARVPQTRQPISAVSGPKFTILRGRLEEILLFNKFFLLGEYWKYFMARLNGVHAFGYNCTGSEPIWMKFEAPGTLSTLFAAGPGRFWVRSAQKPERESEPNFCFFL